MKEEEGGMEVGSKEKKEEGPYKKDWCSKIEQKDKMTFRKETCKLREPWVYFSGLNKSSKMSYDTFSQDKRNTK